MRFLSISLRGPAAAVASAAIPPGTIAVDCVDPEIGVPEELAATVRAPRASSHQGNVIHLVQRSEEETEEVIKALLGAHLDKHQSPVVIGKGGMRIVLQCPGNENTVIKVSRAPQLISNPSRWEHRRNEEFHESLSTHFPREWLLPEHPHSLTISKKGGKAWVMLADFQMNLNRVYQEHASAPQWCYCNAEMSDGGGGAKESYHPYSLTVPRMQALLDAVPGACDASKRDQHLRVTRQLVCGVASSQFDEEGFLDIQRSPYLARIFRRAETDPLFRERFRDFIDAATIFSHDTGEILDGMGRGNILFRDDMACDPLLIDVQPPDPPRILSLARSLLPKYADIRKKGAAAQGKPLTILCHALNYTRSLNASRRKLEMDPADDIRLADAASAHHLDTVHDDLVRALSKYSEDGQR